MEGHQKPGTNGNSTRKAQLKVLETPFCGDLRSKKYYLRDAILTSAEEYYDGSGHIWCYHTQMPVGPDGYRVAPEHCGPNRPCYRSALAQPTVEVVMRKMDQNTEANLEV